MNIRTFRRAALLALAVVAGLVVLLLLAIHTPWAREYLQARLKEQAQAAGISLEVESLRYNLPAGYAELEGVTIRRDAPSGLPPFLTAKKITADLSVMGLLTGSGIALDSGTADGLVLHIVREKDGTTNVPDFGGDDSKLPSDELPGFLISSFTATGAVIVEDRANAFEARLPAWKLNLSGNALPLRHRVELQLAQNGTLRYQGRSREIETLRLTGAFDRNSVTVEQLALATGQTRVGLAGTMTGFARRILDITADTQLDLRPLLAFAGMNDLAREAQGLVTAKARVREQMAAPDVNVEVATTDLRYQPVGSVDLKALALWDGDTSTLRLQSADVDTPHAALHLQAAWAGSTPEAANHARVRIQRANLLGLTRQFGSEVQIASSAAGTVEANWRGTQFEAADARARLQLSALEQQPAENVLPLSGNITANARDRRVHLEAREVRALGAATDATVDVTLTDVEGGEWNGRLSGDVTGGVDDLKVFVSSLAAFLGESGSSLRDQEVAGEARVAAKLGGTIQRPSATVALNGTGMRYGPLENLAVDVDAAYDPALLKVDRARIAWEGSEITADGRVALQGTRRELAFNARSTPLSIEQLLKTAGDTTPVSGTVSLTATGSGTIEDPTVAVNLQGAGLVAYNEPLGQLTADATYSGETLNLQGLTLTKPEDKGSLQASGTYNTGSRDYSVRATADHFTITNLALPDGQPARGVIHLNATGEGNVASPQLTLDFAVRETEVGGRKLGEITAEARMANNEATVNARVPAFQLSANVQSQLTAPYPVKATLDLNNLDFQKLPLGPAERPPVEGSITAQVRASGEAQNWRQGEASIDISNLRLETPAGPVTNDGAIQAAFRNQTLEIARARLAGPKSTVTMEGQLPLEAGAPSGAIRLQGHLDLTALQPLIVERTGITAAGELDLRAGVTGTLAKLEPEAQLALRNGSLQSPTLRNPVQNIQMQAALTDGAIDIRQLDADVATGKLTAKGAVPLGLFPLPDALVIPKQTGPAKFTLQATGIHVEELLQLPETVQTDIALTVEATADRPELNAIQATATFDSLNLQLAGIRLAPQAPPQIALRNGVASVERFALQGDTAEVRAAGAVDLNSRELKGVELAGNFDAALLTSLTEDVVTTGPMKFQLAANGTTSDPKLGGFFEWTDGQVAIDEPAVQATRVAARVNLDNNRVNIERFEGDLNGGFLSATGGMQIAGGTVSDARLDLMLDGVYLEFPEGMQTQSNAVISVRPQGELIIVGGAVLIQEGSYTRNLDIQTELLQYLRNRGGVELVGRLNPTLARVRFGIDIETHQPVVMDNNLGELALNIDLRLLGTYYRPGLAGRVEIEEGGQLNLQENEYIIERGVISFVNETRIEPLLDLTTRTQVANRTITMRIFSEKDGIKTDLTSDNPDDTRADIIALLLTGRTAEKLEGRELTVAGEQAALSLVAGSFTGRLSEGLTNAVGLSRVRIEPSLISAEANPTARLTIGQDLTTDLEFVYSMDLTNSSDQIYILDYDLTRRFNTRATRQNDNSYRFDFQHDLRFGGIAAVEKPRREDHDREVAAVNFTGDLGLPAETVIDKFNVERGQRYDFFKVRNGVEALQSLYKNNNYLEARVRLSRRIDGSRVYLDAHVTAGPKVEFVFENYDPGGEVREAIRNHWTRGVFDTQRVNNSVETIRGRLAKDGFLRPEITHTIRTPEPDRKVVTFEVQRGVRYRDAELAFDGAVQIEPKILEQQLGKAKLKDKIHTEPDDVLDFLTGYYEQEGFLDVAVSGPEYDLKEQTRQGVIRFVIQEGARYKIGEVRYQGAKAIPPAELVGIAALPDGAAYKPQLLQDSRDRIEETYWARGYREVALDYRVEKNESAGLVNLIVDIQEGPQSVVEELVVRGNDQTSPSFIRRQIVLEPGKVLDYRLTARSRRNLYDTGAFTSVDLRTEPVEANGSDGGRRPVRVVAEVRERTPFQFRYGGFFDTERGPGVIADFSNRNSLGSARLLGLRTRYDGDIREVRGYFSQPLLRSLPLRSDGAVFRRRELREAFITDRTGGSFQQEAHLSDFWLITYGYRYERAHTFDRNPTPDILFPFDETLNIAPLTSSLSRDTRDEVLDATRGSFNSHSLEFSTATLGSSLRFIRYFGQYFRYFGLTDRAPAPFRPGEISRVVYATGLRVGLARGLGGQEIIPSERFFAGGGTTVRGFKQDELGPRDFLDRAAGGNAMLVFNNELRFPLYRWFDGVSFLDVGNVYPLVSDMRLGDLRKTGGVGLRLRTPYLLLRVDYGVKFDRRPGESRGAIFFSIGQAF